MKEYGLQIVDTRGKVIKQDTLRMEEGDTLIIEYYGPTLDVARYERLAEMIKQGLERRGPIMLFEQMRVKVLKR